MKRKTRKLAWSIFAIVLVAVIAYALLPTDMGGGGALGAGYNVLSISKMEYTTSDNMWNILISQSRGGDVLRATLTPDNGDKVAQPGELVSTPTTQDGVSGSAKYPVEITLTPISEACTYPIKSTANLGKIIQYNIKYYPQYALSGQGGLICDVLNGALTANNNAKFYAIQSDCMALGSAASTNPKDYFLGWTYNEPFTPLSSVYPYCIYPTVFGRVGDTNTQLVFKTNLGVTVNGVSKSVDLTFKNKSEILIYPLHLPAPH